MKIAFWKMRSYGADFDDKFPLGNCRMGGEDFAPENRTVTAARGGGAAGSFAGLGYRAPWMRAA